MEVVKFKIREDLIMCWMLERPCHDGNSVSTKNAGALSPSDDEFLLDLKDAIKDRQKAPEPQENPS